MSFQYLSRSSLHRLAGLSCHISCRNTWSPSGDTQGPSVVFEAVDVPCAEPLHFPHDADYVYGFCPLPDPDVCPSVLLRDVEHTSFYFGLCIHKFVLCLLGECPLSLCRCNITELSVYVFQNFYVSPGNPGIFPLILLSICNVVLGQKLTEGRVMAFNHEVVPDYLRTKPDPEVDDKMMQFQNRASQMTPEMLQVV